MKRAFPTLLIPFLLLAPTVQAQDETAGPPPGDGEAAAESPDDFEPAVSSAVLAAEARRDEGTRGVMDELTLDRTEITGNQELPKVLYIVPWQKSDPGDLMGQPVNTLLNDVLAPVDRTEFRREVDYYHRLQDDERD